MTTANSNEIFLKATLIASSFSGLISRFISHPIDTVKAKAQVDASKLDLNKLVKNRSLISLLKSTLKNEGLKGFYPGVGIATIGSVPAVVLYFTTYEYSKTKLSNLNDSLKFFMSGMCAEAISCLLFLPIDIVKERLQVQANLKTYSYKNSFDAISKIVQNDGILGLYKAYGATLASFGPFSALTFMFYENFKLFICKNPKSPEFYESFLLSATSSSLAGVITSPLDMAKLRMQIQRGERALSKDKSASLSQGRFGYKNLFHGIYLIYAKEGFLALYKGIIPRVWLTVVSVTLNFSLLEWCRKIALEKIYDIKH